MVNKISVRELVNEDLDQKETTLIGGKQVSKHNGILNQQTHHLQVLKLDERQGHRDLVHAVKTVLADVFLPAGYPSSVSSGDLSEILLWLLS